MTEKKTIRYFTGLVFASMLVGANIPAKLWNAPDFIYVLKQMGLVAVLAILAYGLAVFLVRVLKVKINPR